MKYVIILTIFALFSACYYDNEVDLYPDEAECNSDQMSLEKDIAPILKASCGSCHYNGNNEGAIQLDSFAELKIWVDNDGLLGSINFENGWQPMPKNASKLSDCSIKKIQAWVDQGALNN